MTWIYGTGKALEIADMAAARDALTRANTPEFHVRAVVLSPEQAALMVRAERWRERQLKRASYRGSRKARRAERLLRGDCKAWFRKTPSQRRRILRAREALEE